MDESYVADVMSGEMPIGSHDFKEIREKDHLYVDKTDMIPRILSKGAKVHLYTRPRRFGKSLNLNMLDAFFNMKYPRDNKWFDGLKVSECEMCRKHKNAHPVIYLSLKDLKSSDFDLFVRRLGQKFSDLYGRYTYLEESDELNKADKEYYDSVFMNTTDVVKIGCSLRKLSEMLFKHHGRKVVILIDEYDNPIHHSHGKPFQQDVIDLIREILSSAFKDNESLEFGVIVGVMQIAKESIFSGLNNLCVNNVLSKDFDESFGFTENEVRAILTDKGHPEKYDEVREWYDGYRFGNTDVYNPWSLLNYVECRFEPRPYWAGTSGNDIVDTLIDNANESVLDDLLSLSQGIGIRKRINTTVTMKDLEHDTDAIYSLMVMSGYLTAVEQDGDYKLFIPNGEMYRVFGDVIGIRLNRRFNNRNYDLLIVRLSNAILRNDPEAMKENLYNLLAETLGSDMLTHEHVYQGFLTGLLMNVRGMYKVTAEMENGKGRYDILLRSESPRYPNIIMELKRSASESSLQHDAEQALSQILERDYVHGLPWNSILYGVSFKGKQPFIVSKTISK